VKYKVGDRVSVRFVGRVHTAEVVQVDYTDKDLPYCVRLTDRDVTWLEPSEILGRAP
jgi:hypothetical protein